MPVDSKAPRSGVGGPAWLPLAAVATGALFLSPLLFLLAETARLGGDFWATAVDNDALGPLWRSLSIATTASAVSAVLGTALAVAVARTDLPGRRPLRIALALPLVIPSFVGATALRAAFGPGGLVAVVPRPEGFWGALLVLSLLSYPYVYLPVLARLRTTDPALEEAARQLGSNPRRTLLEVVLPQLRPSIAAGAMLVFLYGLSDFGAVSLMRYDTITRAIFSARLFDRTTSLTLGLMLGILALAVALIERRLAPDPRAVPVSTAHPPVVPLGAGRRPATLLAWAVAVGALLVPISVFVVWMTRSPVPVGAELLAPVANSVLVAVAAGIVATIVLLPLGYAMSKRRTRLTDVAGAAVTSVFALPGLVVALAIVFWAIRAPSLLGGLYQSFPLLILGYVLHFGALSLRTTQATVAAIPRGLDDAARTLGVGWWRRFREVELPLLIPGLLSGGGLVMLSTLKELPATLLLAPVGFQTLATQVWGAAEDGFYSEVGMTSLTLIAVSGVLTWLLVLRSELKGAFPSRASVAGTSGPSRVSLRR